MAAIAADRNLLFGLLALQNGLIDQGQLVAAFQAWTRDKARPLADHLVGRGDLDADAPRRRRGDGRRCTSRSTAATPRQSLAAIPAGRSTRESLARLGDPDIERHARPCSARARPSAGDDADRTASYAVGTATSDGQRFRVLRPHARGGLGAVFVALDAELHREVALKQILDHHADDPASRQRFLLEAEITGGLEHPGIVPVYGLGTYADGRPYYAMRFIRGDSLKEAIDRFHADAALQARPRPAVAGAAQAAAAVPRRLQRDRLRPQPRRAAPRHQAGQHHRRQARRDAGGRLGPGQGAGPGRARAPTRASGRWSRRSASGSRRDAAGHGAGDAGLHEPRAGRGRPGPARARGRDVYSLGATLYCLLTGKPPFEGDDVGDVLRGRAAGRVPAAARSSTRRSTRRWRRSA